MKKAPPKIKDENANSSETYFDNDKAYYYIILGVFHLQIFFSCFEGLVLPKGVDIIFLFILIVQLLTTQRWNRHRVLFYLNSFHAGVTPPSYKHVLVCSRTEILFLRRHWIGDILLYRIVQEKLPDLKA